MENEEYLAFEEDGQGYEMTASPKPPTNDEYEHYGPMEDAIAQMHRTQIMIRTCAVQAVSAFRNFGARLMCRK